MKDLFRPRGIVSAKASSRKPRRHSFIIEILLILQNTQREARWPFEMPSGGLICEYDGDIGAVAVVIIDALAYVLSKMPTF